jgi:hypothetical protein
VRSGLSAPSNSPPESGKFGGGLLRYINSTNGHQHDDGHKKQAAQNTDPQSYRQIQQPKTIKNPAPREAPYSGCMASGVALSVPIKGRLHGYDRVEAAGDQEHP